MILGIGIDLVELGRIEKIVAKFGVHFSEKILSPREIAALQPQSIPYLAGRFAAKEACAKALGTGFANGAGPRQIEILNNANGKPELFLHGAALNAATSLGATRCHVSISHEQSCAAAIVILED